ncbi:MAG: DUF481 domain-containing protein [Candidatus Aceula meridiana]|nr:DUF481 domain-containing protein [Candidatus Aceula meridiana]
MTKKGIVFLLFCFCVAVSSKVSAEEIYFKNNDKITGTILAQEDDTVTVETQALGIVTIRREFLNEDEKEKQNSEPEQVAEIQEAASKLWTREFSAGYSLSTGNTEKSQLSASFETKRKTERNEFTLKAESLYSSTDEKMDSQRYSGMARYAFSFSDNLKWYNFYKFEADHDRFSNIDYRLVPSTGVGYWFSDAEDFKFMTELGAGYEYTDYRDRTESTSEGIFIPRLFLEKRLIGKTRISNDITMYFPVGEPEAYRVKGEAALTSPLDDYWSLKLSVVDEFNNRPGNNTKKNDLRFISSVVYSF